MPQKNNKTNRYEELKQFKLKKGHCEVPQKNNKTNYQHYVGNKYKISIQIVAERWTDRYEELKQFTQCATFELAIGINVELPCC